MAGKKNDCWNHIGVWGREVPACPLLAEVVHCRNCGVFQAASRQVFEREPPPNYQQEWTHFLAEKKTESIPGTHSVLVFRLGDEWASLPTTLFQDVEAHRPIHKIPHNKNDFLRGMVSINGEIQLCFSLGALLGIDKAVAFTPHHFDGVYERMLIMAHNKNRYVFPVNEVSGILRYHVDELQDIPASSLYRSAKHVLGLLTWEKKHVACLDAEQVFATLERSLQS